MKRFFLFISAIFIFVNAFSQVQITDFETIVESSPNNISYKTTINNKIIFTANTPENGTELWVSDGTKDGTKMLKEFTEGKQGTNFYYWINQNGWTYFSTGVAYWRTDGLSVESTDNKVTNSSQSILGYYEQYPIIMTRGKTFYGDYPYTPYTSYELAIIKNQKDSIIISERPIFSHIVLEDRIYYNTYNHKDSLWTFNCYVGGKSELIHSEKLLQMPEKMSYVRHEEYLYFKIFLNKVNYSSVAALPNYQCIIKLKDDSKKDYELNKFIGNLSFYKNERTNKNYLFHQNGSKLEIFELNYFKLLNTFNLNKANCSGYGSEYKAINYDENKLSYIVTNGSFLDYSCVFLFEHDIAKESVRRSSNLIKIFSTSITDFAVQYIDDSKYSISSNSYSSIIPMKKAVYNLSDNSWEDVPVQPVKKQDIIQLLEKKIIISVDDIRLQTGESILSKSYYNPSIQYSIRKHLLKDKIIFLRYFYGKNQYELYASDGEKLVEFLTTISGKVESLYELDGKLIFYSNTTNGNFYLYQTDGTKANTKLLYETTKSDYVGFGLFSKNNKQIAMRITEIAESILKESYLLIIEGETVKKVFSPVDLSNFHILSVDNTFFLRSYSDSNNKYDLYKIEKDSLKRVPEKSIFGLYSYKNRLYFHKPSQAFNGVYSIDKDGGVNPFLGFVANIHSFLIQESIMILFQQVSQFRMNAIFIDLETEKEILRFETDYHYLPFCVKNKQYILLQLSNEVVIVDLSNRNKRTFAISQEGQTTSFGDGFLISNWSSLKSTITYYEFNLANPIKVINGTVLTNYYQHPSQTCILYSEIIDNQLFWRCFFPKTNSIVTQKSFFDGFVKFTQHGIIVSFEKKTYFFKLENTQFVKKLEIDFYDYSVSTFASVDSNDYLLSTNLNTQAELAELTKDSLIYFPRIEKGTTDISLDNIFHFKGNVYLIANAPSVNVQVWKMGKIREQDIVLEKEEDNGIFIQIFPNPTTDKLRIECAIPSKISLFNTNGVIIREFIYTNEIDVQSLSIGVYILRFQNERGVFNKRFVKY